MSTTTNYGWTKPDIGGSNGTWGTSLNADLDSIDADLFTVSEAADDAQAAADNAQDTADEALAASQAVTPIAVTLTGGDPYLGTVDLNLGSFFIITQSHNYSNTDCRLTFTNRPATEGRLIYLHFVVTANLSGQVFNCEVTSSQQSWALASGHTAPGTTIGTITGTKSLFIPMYIVAGV